MTYRLNHDGEIELIGKSSGCWFCDLGDIVRDLKDKPAHYLPSGAVMFCVADTPQTPDRPQ